jgi:hypothetical protein
MAAKQGQKTVGDPAAGDPIIHFTSDLVKSATGRSDAQLSDQLLHVPRR